ncbi:MAG: helix-turn-helix domain-containing protein [Erythrobacter sp.]
MTEAIDTAVRLVASGATLLLLTLLLAGEVRAALKVPLAGLMVGALAYLANSSTAAQTLSASMPLVNLASIMTPLWLWLLARNLFEREPPLWLVWTVIAVFVVNWLVALAYPTFQEYTFYFIHGIGLVLVVDLVRTAFADREDDLIEKRRKIRLWLPIVIAAQTGGILLVEVIVGMDIVDGSRANFTLVHLINAILILLLTLFAGLALLKPDTELLARVEGKGSSDLPTDDGALSPQQSVLSDKLSAAMEDGFYRTPGLTITELAAHLETPEHRLRALINQHLGYRNFSSFLNHHRIDEAKKILSDRSHVDLPVITIAMDLGYNSLPTFNRAFKSEASQTPTDFRRKAISQN